MKTQDATTTTEMQAKAKKATKKPATERGKKAKAAKPKAAKKQSRTGSKTAIVLELLRRKEGATLAEIAKATGWQNHSIRGFISGQVAKKLGLKVESTKSEVGERTYRIAT
jgi:hypothetical protein